MKCDEAAEFLSALCDGERIPRDAAEHIGTCETCRARQTEYAEIGAELRRVASFEATQELRPAAWQRQKKLRSSWWQKGWGTMRIPRIAFAAMVAVIVLLSGGLALVRARTDSGDTGGSVVLLTFQLPIGMTAHCSITMDENPKTNHCNSSYSTGGVPGLLTMNTRFVGKDGQRTQLGVKTRYDNVFRKNTGNTDDLKDLPEQKVWILPGQKQYVNVAGLGDMEITAEYLDYVPALRGRPQALDPKKNEFRAVTPVLIRGKEVLASLDGNSIDCCQADAALMIYLPGEGRYLISTVPFQGAVEGSVRPGQIKFNLEGQDYLLLTAMPTTRAEHVWVTHEPGYKISEHIQGARDDWPSFRVRSLKTLLQAQIEGYQ